LQKHGYLCTVRRYGGCGGFERCLFITYDRWGKGNTWIPAGPEKKRKKSDRSFH